MAQEQKFDRDTSTRPDNLIIGLVVSILCHSLLLVGANYWFRDFTDEPQLSESIPIEYIEVPPEQTNSPPQTKRRAANNSVAGGKATPKQPVSAARALSSVAPKSSSSPKDSPAPKPAGSGLPELKQSTAILPSPSPQKPQPKPQKTAVAPTILEPQPKPQRTAVAPTIPEPQPKPQRTAVAPTIPKPQPKPQRTAVAPTIPKPQPKPQRTAVAPTIPKPQPLTVEEKNDRLSLTEQLQSSASQQTPSQAQPSQIRGAASSLGGPLSLASRNFGDNSRAALPNSNRSNPGTQGIDARRDADLGPYMNQLQQRVKQQWIPGLTQDSRRTVVYFVVSRSGQVSNLQIVQPSGSRVSDKAALSAIERAGPFAPLPTGYTKDYINIKFTFTINFSGDLELRGGG